MSWLNFGQKPKRTPINDRQPPKTEPFPYKYNQENIIEITSPSNQHQSTDTSTTLNEYEPPSFNKSLSSGVASLSKSTPPRPQFPWSARRIVFPPLLLSRPGIPPATVPSPSPFPRYGHSLPLNASQSGELFLFGGLVHESVKNDLYLFGTRDVSSTLIQTTGEIPPPRVGHTSALISSVLIVWGGDTKQRDTDKQDEGLYLLNLGTREWTRVTTRGSAPAGRYGHKAVMIGRKFLIFGGQVDGEFLCDLWCFDLDTCKPRIIPFKNLS